jgi:hypothetical protein
MLFSEETPEKLSPAMVKSSIDLDYSEFPLQSLNFSHKESGTSFSLCHHIPSPLWLIALSFFG